MIGIHDFWAFLAAGILLNLTPGNDTIYILSRSIAHGRQAGVLSALGIATGSFLHTLFAAFGLSVIITQSIFLFRIVQYVGAGYLAYVGFSMLRQRSMLTVEGPAAPGTTRRRTIYRDAVLTNLLNPKVAMFYLAFLPQFVDPSHKQAALPFIALGFTFTTTGTIWCLILALIASRIQARLQIHRRLSLIVQKSCGAVLLGLGIKLAMSGRR